MHELQPGSSAAADGVTVALYLTGSALLGQLTAEQCRAVTDVAAARGALQRRQDFFKGISLLQARARPTLAPPLSSPCRGGAGAPCSALQRPRASEWRPAPASYPSQRAGGPHNTEVEPPPAPGRAPGCRTAGPRARALPRTARMPGHPRAPCAPRAGWQAAVAAARLRRVKAASTAARHVVSSGLVAKTARAARARAQGRVLYPCWGRLWYPNREADARRRRTWRAAAWRPAATRTRSRPRCAHGPRKRSRSTLRRTPAKRASGSSWCSSRCARRQTPATPGVRVALEPASRRGASPCACWRARRARWAQARLLTRRLCAPRCVLALAQPVRAPPGRPGRPIVPDPVGAAAASRPRAARAPAPVPRLSGLGRQRASAAAMS